MDHVPRVKLGVTVQAGYSCSGLSRGPKPGSASTKLVPPAQSCSDLDPNLDPNTDPNLGSDLDPGLIPDMVPGLDSDVDPVTWNLTWALT